MRLSTNVPVRLRTKARKLCVLYNETSKLGLKVGDLVRIPDSNSYPVKWRNKIAIIVGRYKSINETLDRHGQPATYSHYGVEVAFLDPIYSGIVRRFLSKLTLGCKLNHDERRSIRFI